MRDACRYRDLLLLFVRRDFVAVYKQNIFKPICFFVQPIITTIMFIVIFESIAQKSIDGSSQAVFYLAGVVNCNYFSKALKSTSETYTVNAGIFVET